MDLMGLVAVVGALTGVVYAFIKFIKGESVRRSEESRSIRDNCGACRASHNEVIKNHIEHSTEAMVEVARALKDVARAMEIHDTKMGRG